MHVVCSVDVVTEALVFFAEKFHRHVVRGSAFNLSSPTATPSSSPSPGGTRFVTASGEGSSCVTQKNGSTVVEFSSNPISSRVPAFVGFYAFQYRTDSNSLCFFGET